MNEEVRLPIETSREGNKITKVCVEDVYKIVNRVADAMNKAYNNSDDILDGIKKEIVLSENEEEKEVVNGWLITGTGISQPCLTDAFDEEIGNNLAFMKAKLNANFKKRNFLIRIYNEYVNLLKALNKEIFKVEDFIELDLMGIRKHNPEYLINNYINKELDNSSIQREVFRTNKMQDRFDEV